MPVLRNADHPAVTATDSVAARYAVAVFGAWAAETATYPFDLTKTRLQIQTEVAAAKHGYKVENLGMIKTAVGIARQEGVLKLWTGLMPMFQRHAIYSGCRLIFYEQFREALKDSNGKVSLASASLGGLAAGSLAQLIASPTDLVKVQMQAEGRRVLQGLPRRFKNCREAYAVIYKESGIKGFWRGAVPNVQRAALVNMGDLAAYDYSKQFLMREFGMADNALVHAAAAFMAGFVAAVVGTPADVLKTRLMNQPVGPDGRRKEWLSAIDREDLLDGNILWRAKDHFVCCQHFEDSAIVTSTMKRLKSDAAPTKVLPHKPPKIIQPDARDSIKTEAPIEALQQTSKDISTPLQQCTNSENSLIPTYSHTQTQTDNEEQKDIKPNIAELNLSKSSIKSKSTEPTTSTLQTPAKLFIVLNKKHKVASISTQTDLKETSNKNTQTALAFACKIQQYEEFVAIERKRQQLKKQLLIIKNRRREKEKTYVNKSDNDCESDI